MSDNRGKTIEDCVVEREAEYAWLKHLTDPADIKRCRQRITHLGNRIQKLNEKAREGTEAATPATPSDPHSAEADLPPKRSQEAAERYPFDGWDPAIRILQRSAFDAGRVSRDAEVAELKAKIAAAVARLNAASIPPMMTEAQFNATTITDARRILLGSASSPVEGGN